MTKDDEVPCSAMQREMVPVNNTKEHGSLISTIESGAGLRDSESWEAVGGDGGGDYRGRVAMTSHG